MALPGETLASRCNPDYNVCEDCNKVLIPQVLQSAAGYYIGTACDCGPYSRESGYYPTRLAAEQALSTGVFGR